MFVFENASVRQQGHRWVFSKNNKGQKNKNKMKLFVHVQKMKKGSSCLFSNQPIQLTIKSPDRIMNVLISSPLYLSI